MAHIFVRNSLNSNKAALVDINLPRYVDVKSEGDPLWVLEAATTYPSASGTKIRPAYINKITTFEDLDAAVADSISTVAEQIDWLPLTKDDSAPYVTEVRPEGVNVSIASNVYIDIKDDLPAAGIDLSELKIVLNNGMVDLEITNECEIEGTPFEYNIRWEPPRREMRHYN